MVTGMTGQTSSGAHGDSSPEELEAILQQGHLARVALAAMTPSRRRELMHTGADALLAAADELVPLAQAETSLPEPRLRGEVARAAFQFRLYGDSAAAETTPEIDRASDTAGPTPRPDLRRATRPIGLVLVFEASNFPFGFGVAGTDTASALAAGCPVVAKVHRGHPRLAAATHRVVVQALEAAGAPQGSFGLISGRQAGIAAIRDRRVRAAAFTGSLAGGRHLFGIASEREDPIPFYGELGSLNPVFVGPAAAAARAAEILGGYLDSFTLGAGQFCTKPGLLFWPEQVPLGEDLAERTERVSLHPMLNEDLRQGYLATLEMLRGLNGVRTLAGGAGGGATLLQTSTRELFEEPAILTECFGPASLVVTYAGTDDLQRAIAGLHGTLTASVHADPEDDAWCQLLLPLLEECAGRLVWGGWPTGVAVSRAQHHGGPFPATTAPLHTSVGTHAIDRFLRPIAYQSFPQRYLPAQLRDEQP